MGITVGVPAYNEECSLPALLTCLSVEATVDEIIVIDDCSSDRTADVASCFAPRVKVFRQPVRQGQTAAWLRVVEVAANDAVIFVDADAEPKQGSIEAIGSYLREGFDLVGGLAVPRGSSAWAPARFSALLFSKASDLGVRSTQVIGRLFGVRRQWMQACGIPTSAISNDLVLNLLAIRTGARFAYCPEAIVYYTTPSNLKEFKAQRLRADAGVEQASALGLEVTRDKRKLLAALAVCATRYPLLALSWAMVQLAVYLLPWPMVQVSRSGMWEALASTKTR